MNRNDESENLEAINSRLRERGMKEVSKFCGKNRRQLSANLTIARESGIKIKKNCLGYELWKTNDLRSGPEIDPD